MTCLRAYAARSLHKLARMIEPPRPLSTHANTAPFFECLQNLGMEPRHIVDVGAHRGDWTRTAMLYFPAARYTLFEPQPDLMRGSKLEKDARVTILNFGVGRHTGTAKLTSHERRDSYSFAVSQQDAHRLGCTQSDSQVVALDEFLPSLNAPPVDILKIDAEGWDLEVLAGARNTARQAAIVLIEAAVLNKRNANRVEIVIAEMHTRGFVLFDITDLNRTRRHKALWLAELAFVKRHGELDSAVSSYT
jgi:FkbM family methyltransferase